MSESTWNNGQPQYTVKFEESKGMHYKQIDSHKQ
jgi:hypothetical protein